MSLSFTGSIKELSRIRTGLLSFDIAVAGNIQASKEKALGAPLRVGYHIYSKHTGIGKTIFAISLVSRVSGATGRGVVMCPIDTFSREDAERLFVEQGATNRVHFINEISHSDATDMLEKEYREDDIVASLLDSVAHYASTASRENKNDDSSMGRDALGIAHHVLHMKGITDTDDQDKMWVMTNHLRQDIGQTFRSGGYHTKGGKAPNERTSIHIDLDFVYGKSGKIAFPEGWLLQGNVDKNNFGVTDRIFRTFLVGGHGIHTGMTAAYDCVMFGLANGGDTETKAFSISGKNHLAPRKLMDLASEDPAFDPFKELLQTNLDSIMEIVMTKKKARAKVDAEKAAKKPKFTEVDVQTGEVTQVFEEDVDNAGMSTDEMMGIE